MIRPTWVRPLRTRLGRAKLGSNEFGRGGNDLGTGVRRGNHTEVVLPVGRGRGEKGNCSFLGPSHPRRIVQLCACATAGASGPGTAGFASGIARLATWSVHKPFRGRRRPATGLVLACANDPESHLVTRPTRRSVASPGHFPVSVCPSKPGAHSSGFEIVDPYHLERKSHEGSKSGHTAQDQTSRALSRLKHNRHILAPVNLSEVCCLSCCTTWQASNPQPGEPPDPHSSAASCSELPADSPTPPHPSVCSR